MARPLYPETLRNEIGARLRLFRTVICDAQAVDLAGEFGVKNSTWSAWENGRSMIDMTTAVAIKQKYGLTIDWLVAGDPSGLTVAMADKLNGGAHV